MINNINHSNNTSTTIGGGSENGLKSVTLTLYKSF